MCMPTKLDVNLFGTLDSRARFLTSTPHVPQNWEHCSLGLHMATPQIRFHMAFAFSSRKVVGQIQNIAEESFPCSWKQATKQLV